MIIILGKGCLVNLCGFYLKHLLKFFVYLVATLRMLLRDIVVVIDHRWIHLVELVQAQPCTKRVELSNISRHV